MAQPPANQPPARFHELDALRGLAAIVVVLGHFLMMNNLIVSNFTGVKFDTHGSLFMKASAGLLMLAKPFYSGHEAVLLFFLISGFVLSLPYLAGQEQSYPVFLTRRIFRIYIPYLLGLGLAIAGNSIWHGSLGRGSWADLTWIQPVDWHLVAQHILFIGEYSATMFNTAFWSLVVEMRASLIFPLIFLFSFRVLSKGLAQIGLYIALTACSVALTNSSHGQFVNSANTLCYIGLFTIGIWLAARKELIRNHLAVLPNTVGALLLLFALFLYAYFGPYVGRHTRHPYGDMVASIGAAIVLSMSFGWRPMSVFLGTCIPQFLGRISYSLYLLHGTVLFSFYYALGSKLNGWQIFPLYITTAILLSWMMYHLVEVPSIKYGRSLSNKLFR